MRGRQPRPARGPRVRERLCGFVQGASALDDPWADQRKASRWRMIDAPATVVVAAVAAAAGAETRPAAAAVVEARAIPRVDFEDDA
jgi:hypothetical protein